MYSIFFFFNDTATTEIYTLSLHDALPIWSSRSRKTIRFRLNSAKITMLEATGSSGAKEPRSKAERPPTSTRKHRMMRRLRLRRFFSEGGGLPHCILLLVRDFHSPSGCPAGPAQRAREAFSPVHA